MTVFDAISPFNRLPRRIACPQIKYWCVLAEQAGCNWIQKGFREPFFSLLSILTIVRRHLGPSENSFIRAGSTVAKL